MNEEHHTRSAIVLGLAGILALMSIVILPVVLIWRVAASLNWSEAEAHPRYFDLGDFLGFVRQQHVVAGRDEPLFALGSQIFDANDLMQAILTLDMLAVGLVLALTLMVLAALLLDILPGWPQRQKD